MRTRITLAALAAAAAVVCPAHATVTSATNTVTYTGNGATTVFTVPFKFQKNADISVTVAGVTQSQGSAYTVTGAGAATGTVTFAAAPANATAIVITRTVDYRQITSIRGNRTYDPGTIEDAIDKVAMGEQQLQALYTNPPASVLPSNVAAKLNNVRFADQFSNIQAAITDAGTTGAVIIPPGYVGSDTYSNPNAIAILDLRSVASARGVINVKSEFGAVCDGSADDTTKIQAASNAAVAGQTVRFPALCLVSSAITLKSGVMYMGPGGLVAPSGSQLADAMMTCTSCSNVRIVGLELNGNTNAGGTLGAKYGVKFVGGSNNSISDNYLHDTYQACVFVDSEAAPESHRGRFVKCGRNVGTDNHAFMAGSTGATDLTGLRVVAPYIENACRKGLAIYNLSTGVAKDAVVQNAVLVGGTPISGCDHVGGIYVSGFSNNLGVSVTGGAVSGYATNVQFSSVIGGTISGLTTRSSTGGANIYLTNAVGVSVSGNTSDLSNQDGILSNNVGGAVTDLIFDANIITHSNQSNTANHAGLHLNATTYSLARNNIITDHVATGSCTGTGATGPCQKWATLEDGASDNNTFVGNIEFGAVTALHLYAGTDTALTTQDQPIHLSSFYVNGVVAAATYGGLVLPARAFTAQAIRFRVSTAAAGAGTTTFRLSDGSNNCDFGVACSAETINTNIRQATTAGTCSFGPSAGLTFSVTSTTCGTTQPTVLGTVDVEGTWR